MRNITELEQIIRNNPFTEKEIAQAESSCEGESLYVSLFSKAPSQDEIQRLTQYNNEIDTYKINGREIYLLFSHSIRNSKLANGIQKIKIPSTVRNWKTMNKLITLADAMEGT